MGRPSTAADLTTSLTLPLTHLWFLWVLLILYVAVLILRAPFAALDRGGGWGR
jgi:glucan biosynthesis protein C